MEEIQISKSSFEGKISNVDMDLEDTNNRILEVKKKEEDNSSMREIAKEMEIIEKFINEGKTNLDNLIPGNINPNPELSPIRSVGWDSQSPSPSPRKNKVEDHIYKKDIILEKENEDNDQCYIYL